MAIEVRDAGAHVERLECDRCHDGALMTRTDPQRAPWIARHLRCGAIPTASGAEVPKVEGEAVA